MAEDSHSEKVAGFIEKAEEKIITTEVANQSHGWGKMKQSPGQANDNRQLLQEDEDGGVGISVQLQKWGSKCHRQRKGKSRLVIQKMLL
jgi:hypothetical protein